ncbi:MAG TPA: lipopolysaccharide assembly protein LapA domain-containing protein [Arenimonas sp.]|nr:lipopolysaccharide assembly protein LapA domain-containing protein [Arenimonas sp.]
MRLIKALLALLFVTAGLLFAALNRTPVEIDFGVFKTSASQGFALLAAVLAGALLGGVVAILGSLWRRRSTSPDAQRAAVAANHD